MPNPQDPGSKVGAIIILACSVLAGILFGLLGWNTLRGGGIGMLTSIVFCIGIGVMFFVLIWPTRKYISSRHKKKIEKNLEAQRNNANNKEEV